MGISKKKRRSIKFQSNQFYWWVTDEIDPYEGMLSINIATDDKKFLIKYFATQNQIQNRYIIVLGEFFPNYTREEGGWVRFACPNFIEENQPKEVTPRIITKILTWCFSDSTKLVQVNYKGQIFEK